MTLWLYLHFESLQLDSLFADVKQTQKKTPVIIIVDEKNNHVVQLSKTAAEHGIQINMGLATAASLYRDLHVSPYRPELEKEQLHEIAHGLYSITSDITFFEPNGLLLRVSNMLTLSSGLNNYWHTIKSYLLQLNLSYSYATGFSPLAARLLARTHFNQITEDETYLLTAIKKRSLSDTDLHIKTREKLTRTGVRNLQSLLAIPMADIAKRFDLQLVNYIGRLLGQFKHPVDFYHPQEQFTSCLELLFEIETTQWLIRPLTVLFNKLENFLTLRDQISHEITIVLKQRESTDAIFTVTSAEGDYSSKKWLTLCQLTLESIYIKAPVQKITLIANRVITRNIKEQDLFSGKKGKHTAMELLSLLQAKLGPSAIKGISLSEDPRPEHTTRFTKPFLTSNPPSAFNRKLRPSLMLPTPQKLNQQVTIIQGPERIATGWWDDQPIVRDYFIARSEQGCWLWIFRDQTHQWFLHGTFS